MRIVRINSRDNVAVALCNLPAGTIVHVDGICLMVKEAISKGHKFAIREIEKGEDIIKYGVSIGRALCDIEKGKWVHIHNLISKLDDEIREKSYRSEFLSKTSSGFAKLWKGKTFRGYQRIDGSIGIRNEIWVIPTVGCVNSVGRKIVAESTRMFNGVNGIYCFEHPYGCSQMGEDLERTKNAILGMCRHPNAGGILLLGLGCESLNLEYLRKDVEKIKGKPIKMLNCQDVDDEIEAGCALISELVKYAAREVRSEQSISKLRVGVKCGGSDGLSGITANPLVGVISNLLADVDASVIMSEIPEFFGAESSFVERFESEGVHQKFDQVIDDFKKYYRENGMSIAGNPSPGNKMGGITTLEEKSIGCIQKGGTANVKEVLDYGKQTNCSKLSIVKAPGNDLVSLSAMAIGKGQNIGTR